MSEQKLKDCPFCGAKAIVIIGSPFLVECSSCCAQVQAPPVSRGEPDLERFQAIDRWNNRDPGHTDVDSCPFCGGIGVVECASESDGTWSVYCENCGACPFQANVLPWSKLAAIRDWNLRPANRKAKHDK